MKIIAAVLGAAALAVVAVARMDFNTASQDYNTEIKRVPGSLVAGFGGFKERPNFAAAPEAAKAPAVKF